MFSGWFSVKLAFDSRNFSIFIKMDIHENDFEAGSKGQVVTGQLYYAESV